MWTNHKGEEQTNSHQYSKFVEFLPSHFLAVNHPESSTLLPQLLASFKQSGEWARNCRFSTKTSLVFLFPFSFFLCKLWSQEHMYIKLWSSSTHINAYFASYYENIFAKSIKWNYSYKYPWVPLLSHQTFTSEFCGVPYEHHSTYEAASSLFPYPLFHPLQIQCEIESRFLILHLIAF